MKEFKFENNQIEEQHETVELLNEEARMLQGKHTLKTLM